MIATIEVTDPKVYYFIIFVSMMYVCAHVSSHVRACLLLNV